MVQMSRKDDDSNRSNQLNPNNDAYWSSRAGSRDSDDDDDGVSTWVNQEMRARGEAQQNRDAQSAVGIGQLHLDLVGTNGRWIRLRCGEGASGDTYVQALGNWFWDCMQVFKQEWECEIAYAQLYDNRSCSYMFLRRPDLAGMQMSAETDAGLAALREAEEAEQPRFYPMFSRRGITALTCVVKQWPPTVAEVRTAVKGRFLPARKNARMARLIAGPVS
jgi:hypothetical protein